MKNRAEPLLHKPAILIAAAMLALGAASAQAQQKEPEKPADFKAMQTPGAPATLAPVPGSSSPAYDLITPATGVVNPQPGFTGSKMVMTQAVWQTYVSYLRNDVAIGYGLFMISVDGLHSYAKECNNYACQISPIARDTALDECRVKLKNRRCVVFAEGRNIKYAYQVVP